MDLGKGYFKNFFNKLNATDLILNSILSFCISVFLFYVFFPNTGYKSLTDFFTGETIYANYNKHYDIGFVFLYTIVYFLVLILYEKVKSAVFDNNIKGTKLTKTIFYPLQYFLLLGYLLLYPFDGCFYPVLSIIIATFLISGFIDIRNKQKQTETDGSIHFSYIAIAALALLCFGRLYNLNQVFVDPHHDAEHLTAFYMHTKYNMQYYKDIMLVHGYRDIIEGWLGIHIFGQDNLYTFFLGETLYYNLLIIIFSMLSIFVFNGNPAALICIASLYRNDDLVVLFGIYLLVFITLLKDKIFNNNTLFLSLYIITAFVFTQYWTTMGLLWSVAALPAAVYLIIKILKEKEFKKLIKPAIVLAACLLINAKDFYHFMIQAKFYTEGNLLGFGSIMPHLDIKSAEIYYKMSAVLAIPVLILISIKELLKKERKKERKTFFTTLSVLILILLSLTYTFGRTDKDIYSFNRLLMISVNFIFIIIPYLLYKKSEFNKFLKYTAIITIFFLAATASQKIVELKFARPVKKAETIILNKQGRLDIQTKEKMFLTEITEFINSNSKENDTFLDLTNEGILYYLLDKRPPVPYTSYYNIVSPKQSDYALSLLKNNEPDIIYTDNISAKLDNVYPSLRINSIYRHILLNKNYRLVTDANNRKALLVKTSDNEKYTFTKKEQRILDTMLSAGNLQQLPDAWGKSASRLPVKEVYFGYILQKADFQDSSILNIHFNKPVKGTDIDLIFIHAPLQNETHWVMQTNTEASLLFFTSKTGKMLIPFDNFPSWLLNESISDITIKTDAIITQPPVIKFYKRNYNY